MLNKLRARHGKQINYSITDDKKHKFVILDSVYCGWQANMLVCVKGNAYGE